MIKVKIKKRKNQEQLQEINVKQAVLSFAAAMNILSTGIAKADEAPKSPETSELSTAPDLAKRQKYEKQLSDIFEEAKKILINHYSNDFVQRKLHNMSQKNDAFVNKKIEELFNIIKSSKIRFYTKEQIPEKSEANAFADIYKSNDTYINISNVLMYQARISSKDLQNMYLQILVHELGHVAFQHLIKNKIIKDEQSIRKEMVTQLNSSLFHKFDDNLSAPSWFENVQYAYIPTEQYARFLEFKRFFEIPNRNVSTDEIIQLLEKKGLIIEKIKIAGKETPNFVRGQYGIKFKNDIKINPEDAKYDEGDQRLLRNTFDNFLQTKYGDTSLKFFFRPLFIGFAKDKNDENTFYYGIDINKLVDYNNKIFATLPDKKTGLPA